MIWRRTCGGLTHWALLGLLAVAPPQSAALAAGEDVSCPETISAESRVLAPPPSWEVRYDDAKPQLTQVTFYDGAPSEGASLVYDKESRTAKARMATWRFPRNDGRGYWISCSYSNSSAVLFKKLADDVSECRVTYDRKVSIAGLPEVKAIQCK